MRIITLLLTLIIFSSCSRQCYNKYGQSSKEIHKKLR